MTYTVTRLIAAVLWTTSFTLLASSTLRERTDYVAMIWSVWFALVASAFTGYLILDYLLGRASDVASERIARAVACAVGRHMATQERDELALRR